MIILKRLMEIKKDIIILFMLTKMTKSQRENQKRSKIKKVPIGEILKNLRKLKSPYQRKKTT